MPKRFDRFIHDENIKNFTRQLERATDPVSVVLLKTLLREESDRTPKIRSKPQHGWVAHSAPPIQWFI
jgi:hypothetical protein